MSQRPQYTPTSRETVEAVTSCYRETAVCIEKLGAEAMPPFTDLLAALPQGPTTATRQPSDRAFLVGVKVGERNPRTMVGAGFLMLRTFSLFGGHPFIDKNQKGGREMHYIEMYKPGILFRRIMVGAGRNERVKLRADHHDLCPWSLTIGPSSRTTARGRTEAAQEALGLYDRTAEDWGLAPLLSRSDYARMLTDVGHLFDRLHGHLVVRTLGAPIPKAAAE